MDEDFSEGTFTKPGWIKDPESGDLLPLEKDGRYLDALSAFYASECSHEESTPMIVKIADGRPQVYRICTNCGDRIGTAMSQKDKEWVDSLPQLPDELKGNYQARRAQEKREVALRVAREQFAERGRFTKAYQDYIASPMWKQKRSKVLERCEGVCEGCREQEATEVHHLTYEHFGNEFLFELVGLCEGCHHRWHLGESRSVGGDFEAED